MDDDKTPDASWIEETLVADVRDEALDAGLPAAFGLDESVLIGSAGESLLQSPGKSLPGVPEMTLGDASDEGGNSQRFMCRMTVSIHE